MKIPESVIEAIRDRVDIVQVIGRHIPLKRSGRNHVGLCPFHGEKTPSFNVNPDRKIFHCFGCGEGGDVFKFLSKLNNRPFPEIVRELGKEVGIDVPDREETPAEREAERLRARLLAVNERALFWFTKQLGEKDGAEACAYLSGRELDEKTRAEFELGFGGVSREGLWQALGHTDEEKQDLIKAGLCVSSERGVHDRFFGRVIFPIRDEKFRVVGFGGRVFGERASRPGVPKYLNSSESAVYDKSQVLYRLPQALQKTRKGASIVIVEGYFDAIALERCGLAAVASCGTALTPRHGQILQKLHVPVVVCWDGDAAGQRAVQRAAQVLLPLKIDTRVAAMPVGDDPDTYVARTGIAGAERLVSEAEPLPIWVIAQTARDVEDAGDDVPRRLTAIRALGWLFQAVPEGIERDLYLEQAAKRLGVDQANLARELSVAMRTPERVAPRAAKHAPRAAAPKQPPRLPGDASTLLRLALEQPLVAAALEEGGAAEGMDDAVRALLASVRDLVHGHGTFSPGTPAWAEVRERAGHPDVARVMDEVAGGKRVFEEDGAAEKAVHDLLTLAEFRRLKHREVELQKELEAVQSDIEKARQIQGPLRAVRSRLRELEPGAGRVQIH